MQPQVDIDEAEYQAFVQRFNMNVGRHQGAPPRPNQGVPQRPNQGPPVQQGQTGQPQPQAEIKPQTPEAKPEKVKLPKGEGDFLRRKDKVLGEVYKLAVDHPKRKDLEAKVAKIEQDKNTDAKGAYKALGAVKAEAKQVATDMADLSPKKIDEEIKKLQQETSFLNAFAGSLFTRADQVKGQITSLPKTSSFKPMDLGVKATAAGFGAQPTKLDGPREKFDKHLAALAGAEEKARAEFGKLVGEKNAVVKRLKAGQFAAKDADIRKEIAFLEAKTPGSTAGLAGKLDQAQAALAHNGEPLTETLLNKLLAQKELALATTLAEWKAYGGNQDRGPDDGPGPVQAGLRGDAALDLLEEDLVDSSNLAKTEEPDKAVALPYQWDLFADFDDLALPRSEAAVNANTIQAAKNAGKKFIADAFTANADDPDFVFDLSIQTKPALRTLLLKEANLESVFEVDPALVQKGDQLAKATNNANNDRYKSTLEAQTKEKQAYRESGDTAAYKAATETRLERIATFVQKLESGAGSEKSQNTIDAMKMLAKTLKKELDNLPAKQLDLIRDVAGEMADAIAQNCPNNTSKETKEFDIPIAGGGTEKFSVPEKIFLNKQEFKAKKCLGAGAMGVAFAYEDSQGKTVVVKSSKGTGEAEQEAMAQELKMHQHLMGGDDTDGKDNVLKLEGVVRTADGGMHMVLEQADGGGLDGLGDSMRALSGSNVISQEALNAMQQNLVLQAVKGLKYLQERNMTHHDIKADNFFMSADGTVKLADFGSAQAADNPEGEVPGGGTKSIHGADAYQAPEFDNKTMTGKADTFTLGTMIAGLTSPTSAQDRFKRTAFNSDLDFTSSRNLTALDRLKNAMLDEDPNKRPRIEAVEYSSYLADAASHDPGQVQDLVKASIAYGQKVGKEVGGKQAEIDSLKGAIADGEYKSTPSTDEDLTKELKGAQAPEIIRKRLIDATESLSLAMKRMEDGRDGADVVLCSNTSPDQTMASAIKKGREAEKLLALGNVNDPALAKEIADHLAATQLQYNKLVESVRGSIAKNQQDIDAVNQRPDVKPLLDNLKKADEALRSGPDAAPEKKAVTAAAVEHQTKQLQALAGKVNASEQFAKKFKEVADLAKAKKFDKAKEILDGIQQELRFLGEKHLAANRAIKLGKALAAATTLVPNEVSVLKANLTKASNFVASSMLGPGRQLLDQIEAFLKSKQVPLSGPNLAPDNPSAKADKTGQ